MQEEAVSNETIIKNVSGESCAPNAISDASEYYGVISFECMCNGFNIVTDEPNDINGDTQHGDSGNALKFNDVYDNVRIH